MAGSQDMFDAIVMADERFHGEGYQEGYEEGNSLGIIEGRQYGTLHGAKIGSEIGCYQGFAFAWRCLLHSCTTEKDSKKMKALESLIGMIEKFPYDDPTYDKLHEDLDKIRGKFKQMRKPRPAGTAQSKGISSRARTPILRPPVTTILCCLSWNVRSQPWSGSLLSGPGCTGPHCAPWSHGESLWPGDTAPG
ncbi:protein LTO1 homolog isoform X2 [Callorhinus ursinus]|uniref:protein LTO1 homolog isoform X2 n=1 Tax=Callorhinus ursinus TaxID=34884 RepID=UPI003CD01956